MNTLILHPPCRNPPRFQRHNQQTDPSMAWASRTHGSRTVIRPNTVGDPLLRAVHNIPVPSAFGGGLDVGDVAASVWFRDTQTEPQLSSRRLGQPPLPLLFGPKSADGRTSDAIAAVQAPDRPAPAEAVELVAHNHAAPRVPVFIGNTGRKLNASGVGGIDHRLHHSKA